jgi:hypothetical protein
VVPQDREGTFSTRLFSRYQRNEKALCLALMEMNVEGVSPRKVKIKGKESRRADSNRLPLLIRSVQSGVSEARRRAGSLQDPGLDESNRCEEARRAARKLLPLAA